MIECPICHVMNEEQAHFCSECGQRFAPAASQPNFQSPAAQAPEPVFPSFPSADQSSFQQPQPVQEYQQSSGFAPPQNQFDAPGFGGPPTNPPAQEVYNNAAAPNQSQPAPSFNAPQAAPFNSPQSTSFDAPHPNPFDAPQANPSLDAPQQANSSFDSPPPAFNAPQPTPSFNAPQTPPSYNAPQEVQSQTFPPEPATPPLPARPKLHSPLFDGPDEPDSRQQPPKSGFMGMNKSRGLRSPLLGEDDSEIETPKPHKGLRSPLLRGEDDPDAQRGKGGLRSPLLRNDDDDPPAPINKAKGGLRSPLLGASDDDFAAQSPQKPARAPKGLPPARNSSSHLRSPLLGDVDDFEGDDDDDLPPVPGKTAFPHVRRTVNKDAADRPAEPMDQSSPGRLPNKGLRSPLLGDSDDESPSPRSNSNKSGTGARPRLHSPTLDGPGSQNFEYENDEPYYEEIDDPNVLRSPLLAARSKHIAPPEPPAAPLQRITPAPPAQPSASFPTTNSFSEPANPSDQPDFRERGFPNPQPPGDMWRERGFQETPRTPEPRATSPAPLSPSSPPEVAPSIRESSPAPNMRRSSRSGLLGSADDDEQPINNYRNSHAEPAKPPMVLIVPCALAVFAKLWYMSLMGKALTDSLPFLADQLMQLVVIIALIIFAMTSGKR